MSGGLRIGLAIRRSSKPTALNLQPLELTRPAVTSCAIGPAGATNLTARLETTAVQARTGGNVAALARASSDTATLWAATTTGRVFISKNADDTTNT